MTSSTPKKTLKSPPADPSPPAYSPRAGLRSRIGCGVRHLPDEGGVRWSDVMGVEDPTYHRAAEAVSLWATGDGPEILVLAGARGAGKTQLAILALAKAANQPQNTAYDSGIVRYYRTRTLLGEVKGTYSREASQSESDILRQMAAIRFLVIDEYAAAGLSETDRAILQELFDRRYEDCKRTIIITNARRDSLKSVMDDSTLSRTQETGVIFECTWPSFRGESRRTKKVGG